MRLLDKEEWTEEKAAELSNLWYLKDLYDLTEETRAMLLARAEEEYADMWADRVDALYEAELDRRLEEKC